MNKLPAILLIPMILMTGCLGHRPMPGSEPEIQPQPCSGLTELLITYDNNPFDSRLKPAWGFSCLIRLHQKTILFDTGGDSSTLLYNMSQLRIAPGEVDLVVLSHIHGDHIGGLGGFLEQNSNVTVYLPKSFPQDFKEDVTGFGAKVEEVDEARQILDGVYTTGELGSGIREQSLILTTDKGLVIVTGCSHPGIVNIIRKAKEVVPDCKVYLVVGGWHLGGASAAQLESIAESFCQLGVERVAPCHCSGNETRQLFKQRYGEDYIESGVGTRIVIPLQPGSS